jgi:hypothetical protein
MVGIVALIAESPGIESLMQDDMAEKNIDFCACD